LLKIISHNFSSTFLIIGTTILSIFFFEIYLQYTADNKNIEAERKLVEKSQKIIELRKRGVQIWPTVNPRILISQDRYIVSSAYDDQKPEKMRSGIDNVVPLGNPSDSLLYYCNEGAGDLIYRSDEHGFHNPKGQWNRDDVDIIAIGDSYVQGACVSTKDNVVEWIRRDFPHVINLGSGGNGPLLMYAGLREYGAPMRPDTVLWFFYQNDLIDIKDEIGNEILIRYLEDSEFTQNLIDRQQNIDEFLKRKIDNTLENVSMLWNVRIGNIVSQAAKDTFLLRGLRHLIYGSSPDAGSDKKAGTMRTDSSYHLLSHLLVKANSLVESWEGNMVVVFLPDRWSITEEGGESVVLDNIKRITQDVDIPLIDLTQAFLSEPNRGALFPSNEGHYSARGYHVAGREISAWLQSGTANGRANEGN
jgi:hypothetical protein